MNPIRLLILRMRAIVWTAFTICCIGLAVLIGLASLVLPYAERFRPEIESLLADRLGRPVSLEKVEAQWTVTGPQLIVQGLGIGSKDDPESMVWVDVANIGYDIYGFLRSDRGGRGYFRLMSDRLELIRQADGRWSLSGLSGGERGGVRSGSGALDWVLNQGGISASARELRIIDERLGRELRLSDVTVDFGNFENLHRLSIQIASPTGEGQVSIEAELETDAEGAPAIRAYLTSDSLDLAGWLEGADVAGARLLAGQGSLTLWAEYDREGLRLRGDAALDSLILAGHHGLERDGGRLDTRFGLDELASGFELTMAPDGGWRLDLAIDRLSRGGRAWPASELTLMREPDGGSGRYDGVADFLRIEDVAAALVVFEGLPERLRVGLFEHAPRGDLSSVRVNDLRPGWPMSATGEMTVTGAGIAPVANRPGLDNISGRLALRGTGGWLDLDAASASFELPGVLRWPLFMDFARGRVEWSRTDGLWRLDLDDMKISNEGVALSGRGSVLFGDGTRPWLDVRADVSRGQVAEARRYWPVNRFAPPLVDWLDRALVSGQVEQGVVVLYGDMDDWPFSGHEGVFEARAEIESTVLDFHPDWPRLEAIDASLAFDSRGMRARARSASMAEVPIAGIEADLPRFASPRLDLEAHTRAEGTALLRLLRESPIEQTHGRYLAGLTVDGETGVNLKLSLPFGRAPGDRIVDGRARLDGNRVADDKWGVMFEQTRGEIRFSDSALEARDLETRYRGQPATLSLWTGEHVEEPGMVARGRLVGRAPASAILDQFPVLQPVLRRLSGESTWQADLLVAGADPAAGEQPPRLVLRSDLVGATLDLPAPLTKSADQRLPLVLATDLPDLTRDLAFVIGDIVRLNLRQPPGDTRWTGNVHFGPGPGPEDETGDLRVDGHIDELDLDRWRDLVMEVLDLDPASDQEPGALSGIDLDIDRLWLAGRQLTGLELTATRGEDYWSLAVDGDQMKGTLRLPLSPDPNRLMLAEFERLHWPAVEVERPDARILPERVPPLRFFASDLTFLDIPVGSVSFESFPTMDGMHIDQLETSSDVLSISANGDWISRDEGQQSRFAASVTGEDCGRILEAFGFSDMISGGQTVLRLDASWDGAPSDFELSALGGDLEITIGGGEITEVEPGAGRLFGLLSLTQIPRRLRLDFSDLFRSGMVFDSIEGRFELARGDAFTDNLTIKSPTAEVQIRGRTGLAEQDYNQIITVVPKVGETLPLVGALAGGGAGAAALLVFQGLFGGQIERITQYHYSVTGSWEEPVVELLGANESQLSAELPATRPEG